MEDQHLTESPSLSSPPEPRRIALRPVTIILFLLVFVLVIVILGWPYLQLRYNLPWSPPISLLPVVTSFDSAHTLRSTPTPNRTSTLTATLPLQKSDPRLWLEGLIVLSIQEGVDTHLFAYQPMVNNQGTNLPLTRLTAGSWEDIHPAISPQSDKLAFTSNRNGFWNIYLLDLARGDVIQITNTPDYAASPSWSPDGLWMAYETYIGESLDIYLKPVDGNQEPIQLTNDAGADFAPAWAPNGRQIAFVSSRDGRNRVWLANLDDGSDNRFQRLSGVEEIFAAHPIWSPEGRYLVWSAVTTEGLHKIYRWDSQNPDAYPVDFCTGDLATWSPKGEALLVVFNTPFDTYLTAYSMEPYGSILLPPLKLPGRVNGLLWADMALSGDLVLLDHPTPTPLWQADLQVDPPGYKDRWDLVALEDVEAPYSQLHDRVDESFQALRVKLASAVGWDLLVDLENAFIPLSSALSPGLLEDWLYTGRAFSVNTLPIKAGWMVVVREDFGPETYWRVYLRTRFQDGSQGRPINQIPWDFNARYSGNPKPYEQGGDFASIIPAGYWVDMTRLVEAYGWQRLPALSTWRMAYPSARYNEFAFTEGLTWESAMLEIYPPEILLTLTPLPSATPSTTPTPLWFLTSTPTSTSSLTSTWTPTTSPTPAETATNLPATQKTPSPTIETSLSPSPTRTGTAMP